MTQETGGYSFGTLINLPALAINGPFDFMHPKIDEWVAEQIDKGNTAVVLDLTAAYYITAMGFAAMFKMVKKISAAGGLLHIAGATPDMIELITLGKMDKYVSYIVN
jgi:anti-anti-sigma factor